MYPTHKRCLLCNSSEIKDLKGYQEDYLVSCTLCGFIFSQRIPSEDELITHYKKYKRGGAISNITIKRYNELLDKFEKFRDTNNILDIGCGDGYFLETAQKRGWKVYGTEFTDEAMAVCRSKQITIHQGVLNPANYNGIRFDVVTSFEVIEHINNPREEIKNIKEILRHRGALYVTTPNFNSFSRFFLGHKWNVIEYPEHLSYYTPKTINKFFTKNGFSKIQLETTGINISRFNKSMDKASSGASEEVLREKAESQALYKFLKKSVNFFLHFTTTGDNLKALYMKKTSD